MSIVYVIYHKETTRYLDGKDKKFKTVAAAKRYLTLAIKNGAGLLDRNDYAIADYLTFHNEIEKMVTRVNLMSGKEFEERVNTPRYCSPAFESYWSM